MARSTAEPSTASPASPLAATPCPYDVGAVKAAARRLLRAGTGRYDAMLSVGLRSHPPEPALITMGTYDITHDRVAARVRLAPGFSHSIGGDTAGVDGVVTMRWVDGDIYLRVTGKHPAPGKDWVVMRAEQLATHGLGDVTDPAGIAAGVEDLLSARAPLRMMLWRGAVTCGLRVSALGVLRLPVGAQVTTYVSRHPVEARRALRSTMPVQVSLDGSRNLVEVSFDMTGPMRALARLMKQPAHGLRETYQVYYRSPGEHVRITAPNPSTVTQLSP